MGLLGAAHGCAGKTAHHHKNLSLLSYSDDLDTVTPYLMKIQKLYESRDTALEFFWHKHFLLEVSKFCYIKKYRYILHFDA